IQPHSFWLVSREAALLHGRPVLSVRNDGRVSTCDLGKVIPVAAGAIEGDVAVGYVEVECPIVIQVSELRAETPPSHLHTQITGELLILEAISGCIFFREP